MSWIGKYASRDAVLVEILYEAGAVPFVRTNVPQTLMVRRISSANLGVHLTLYQWPETYNKIFGRTLNPSNRKLTCGGSSGGEGALVAMKGSPLGVGSDIGGYDCNFTNLRPTLICRTPARCGSPLVSMDFTDCGPPMVGFPTLAQ